MKPISPAVAIRRRHWLPLAVLVAMLAVTFVFARSVTLLRQARARADYERLVERTRGRIQRTINANLILLDGLRGLANAQLGVTRQQFYDYVEELELREKHPGVQGLGFAERVPTARKAEMIASVKERGVRDFHIWPEAPPGDMYPVVYLAPADEANYAGIGFDLASEPVRRAALEQAITTGKATASSVFRILTGANAGREGLFLVTPVYETGTPPDEVKEREKAVRGFYLCVYRLDEFFRAVSALEPHPEIAFRVYEGQGAEGQAPLRYDSAPGDKQVVWDAGFNVRRVLSVADREWTIDFAPTTALIPASRPGLHMPLLVIGTVISLLTFLLFLMQVRRRAAAEELAEERRRADSRYRRLVEQSLVGIYVIQGGRFIYVNPKMADIFGYSAAELTSRPLLDFMAEGSREMVAENIEKRLRGEVESIHYALQARRADGAIIEIEAHGGLIEENGQPAILGSLIDVTERTRAARWQQEQVGRLSLLQKITRSIAERKDLESIFREVIRCLEEEMPVDFCCIARYEAKSGDFLVHTAGTRSRTLAAELGLRDGARLPLEGSTLRECAAGELVQKADLATAQSGFAEKLRSRGGLHSLVAAPLPGGKVVFGALLVARREARGFSSGDGEFLRQLSEHVALAARQAELHGELQRAYDELRRTQQAAVRQERLQAVGELANGIANDINNAISPVSFYAETILENEPQLASRTREFLEAIQRATEEVATTVARMREFSRGRAADEVRAPVLLNRVVAQARLAARERWGAEEGAPAIEIREELAAELPAVEGVENEICEALTNLIFNAVDAMPAGGLVTLRTGVRANEAGTDEVFVEIRDEGRGMDEETQRHCLEPFFTTKGERGTGLGLAIVYGMSQRHGAKIDIESAPGHGTTVRLRFPPLAPRASGATPAAAPTANGVEQEPGASRRILVVDDDPALLKSLSEILQRDGYEVALAEGGQAGIDAFQARLGGEPFDTVITDLGMPDVDGRKVAEAVKGAAPNTGVIMLTGWGRLMQADEKPAQVDVLLSKPCKLRELREALNAVAPGGK